MTSSLHGLHELGYTRTTKVLTKGRAKMWISVNPKKISQSRSLSETRQREVGIASNRGSPSHGE